MSKSLSEAVDTSGLKWSSWMPFSQLKNLDLAFSGLYMIGHVARGRQVSIHYIGKHESDIGKRLCEHTGDKEENLCVRHYHKQTRCYFKYVCAPKADLAKFEKSLIQLFGNKYQLCNIQHNPRPLKPIPVFFAETKL